MLLGLVVGSVGGCGEEVEEVGSADLGVLTCPPWNVPISRVRIWDTTRGLVCRESVTRQSRSSATFVRH
jgi:hypothetical protein